MQASVFSRSRHFQNVGVNCLVGSSALELAILVLKRFHLRDVADFHAAELRFPAVKRRRADPVAAAKILGREARVVLLEDGDDLRLGEPGLLHGWSPSRPVTSEFSTYSGAFLGYTSERRRVNGELNSRARGVFGSFFAVERRRETFGVESAPTKAFGCP